MHTDQQGVEHPVTMKPHTEHETEHFAVCDECGARWAGPFGSRQVASAVARLLNADATYVPPRQLRQALCCVEWVPDEAPAVTVHVEDEADAGPLVPSGWVTARQVAADVGRAGIFLGYAVFVVVRGLLAAMAGLVRLVVTLGWLVIPIVAVVLFVSSKMPPVPVPRVGVLDLVAWVALPVALAVVGVVAWRLTRPRPVEPPPAPIYSTPLTTPRGAATVVDVSKTPADSKPQGETAGAAGTRHTTP